MLVPETIRLRNYCQHSEFELNFSEGTTAIQGPNGCGKSTIFSGIVYALTGWCDPAWGSQKELQKDGEALPGFAELSFTIEGSTSNYTVRRYTLTGGKYVDNLEKDGELIAHKRQKVNDEIESLVGLPCNLLAQLMWVRQEAASWLLTCPPAGVNQVLAQLFDCSKIEKLRDILKKGCDKIPLLRNDFDSKAQQAKSLLADLPDMLELEDLLAKLKAEHLELYAMNSKLEVSGLLSSPEKEARIEEFHNRFLNLVAQLAVIPDVDKPSVDLREEESELLRNLRSIESSIPGYTSQIDSLNNLLAQLNSVDSNDLAHCYYCGSVLSDKDSYLKASTKAITNGAFDDLTRAKEHYSSVLENNKQSLQRLITEKELVDNKLSEVIKNKEHWRVYLNKIELEKHNKQLYAEIKQCEESAEAIQKAETADEVLDQKAKLTKRLAKLETNIKQTEELLNTSKTNKEYAEHLLEEAVIDKKAYTRNETLRLMLSDIRASMSQSRGQAIFLNSKIEDLNNQISDYMALTDMPFNLWLDKEEHLFKYKMLEDQAVEHSAAKLSGAQKAIASLVIQLSLIQVCNVQCRLLLFDEVDASLSPENKSAVVALQRSLLADSSFRLLFITQSEQLTDSCDHVVNIN